MNKKNIKRITLLNVIANVILQLANILSWFIIPKIVLSYFGSSVNGLVSSITQFLSYITLIEGGITSVVTATLYKPLVEKDTRKISSIIKTSNNFYRKIGIIFILYCIALAIVYPIIFDVGFSYIYVFTLVIILSLNLLIQYMFSLTLKNLLNADKKGYIVSFVQTIILILGVILAYISTKIYPSIHILKLLTGLLFALQPIILNRYVKKNYHIDYSMEEDKDLLKQRWNGFAINLAAFIHNCTDIAILTIFTNLSTVSIYSVYTIVTTGLKSIFNAISNAIVPTIGLAYASEDAEELNKKMDMYELITFNLVFYMFTIAGLLITPFVLIYTSGINDANYNQLLFGILLVIAEALYLIKFPHLNLSYTANKFKELTKPAFIEAGINIIVSLILVNKYSMIGVTIGTICGMIYRMIYQVYFTKQLIKSRKQIIFYKKLFIFIIFTLIGLVISNLVMIKAEVNILNWTLNAILYAVIFGVLYLIADCIFFKDEINMIKKYFIKEGKNELCNYSRRG